MRERERERVRWAVYDSKVHGHHCTQLRLGVVSPAVGRDGRPPSLIRVGPRTEREREGEREREVSYLLDVPFLTSLLSFLSSLPPLPSPPLPYPPLPSPPFPPLLSSLSHPLPLPSLAISHTRNERVKRETESRPSSCPM